MPTAVARKDPSGTFRIYLEDENGAVLYTPIVGEREVEVDGKKVKKQVEIGRIDACTLGVLRKACRDSETLADFEIDGGGFERFSPAETLAGKLNVELAQAVAAKRAEDARKAEKAATKEALSVKV